jgi:uncharacterized protein (TIGR02001 family)
MRMRLTGKKEMITMITKKMGLAKSVVGALAISLLAGPAIAQSYKDAPPMTPARALEWSANVAVTSDYIFRGFSQSAERPAVQGGIDVTYGLFYAGVWASGIDFGEAGGRSIATAEVDVVAGIKPKFGPFTFDFGAIYYIYPGAFDPGLELNYVEIKAGVSYEPWKGATYSSTVFYSPEYTGKTGDVWTFESAFSQELPKFGPVTPTFSALLGYQTGDSAAFSAIIADGDDHYYYWNAGVSFAFHERFSIDVRYWGTSNSDGFCETPGGVFNCSDRIVGTAKVTF